MSASEYVSTRGGVAKVNFADAVMMGLADDGGLLLPAAIPDMRAQLASWRSLSYSDLAYAVMSPFVGDAIPAAALKDIICRSYATFATPAVVPVRRCGRVHIAELFHGPTLAFKDVALQFLGNVFEHLLTQRGGKLNILGATSGDTGSAAEYAMRGKEGVRVFMTSPHGRMSAFQQAQMFSLQDENIHNIAIEGVFDDCQDIVKAVSNDLEFKRKYKIGTVNSINWARLLAQVVYYFAGYIQATEHPAPTLGTGVSLLPPEGADSPRGGPSANPNDQKVSFTVPSGNFGNICAGHVARMMGLPIDKLVVATNENDVLDEFFRTGVYRVRGSADTHETSSPSMDISKASNFERFVFDLLGRNGQRTKALFSAALQTYGRFDLSAEPLFADAAGKYGFESGKSTHADRLATIRDTYSRFGMTIDTHTADGVKVAREHRGDGSVPMIVLETALPIKFAETIQEALGHAPERPDRFAGIEALPKRVQVMPADVELVKAYVERHCQ